MVSATVFTVIAGQIKHVASQTHLSKSRSMRRFCFQNPFVGRRGWWKGTRNQEAKSIGKAVVPNGETYSQLASSFATTSWQYAEQLTWRATPYLGVRSSSASPTMTAIPSTPRNPSRSASLSASYEIRSKSRVTSGPDKQEIWRDMVSLSLIQKNQREANVLPTSRRACSSWRRRLSSLSRRQT